MKMGLVPHFSLWLLLAVGLPGKAVGAQDGKRVSLRSAQGNGNPLLERYREWALAYERDAREAEEAAQKYSSMTQAIGRDGGGAAVQQAVRGSMNQLEVRPWANAVWRFEHMLRDPRPAKAAEAAKQAALPYEKQYHLYQQRQLDYENAALRLVELSKADDELAKSLASYAKQYDLEGNEKKAAQFRDQAESLSRQVKTEKAQADGYRKTAEQFSVALGKIWKMANTAREYAAYHENPGNAPLPSQLLSYTVAPPLPPSR